MTFKEALTHLKHQRALHLAGKVSEAVLLADAQEAARLFNAEAEVIAKRLGRKPQRVNAAKLLRGGLYA